MKRYKLVGLLALLVLGGCVSEDMDLIASEPQQAMTRSSADAYYWASGRQIPLKQVPNKYYVLLNREESSEINTALTRSGATLDIAGAREYYCPSNIATKRGEPVFRDCIWTTATGSGTADFSQALYVAPYYTNDIGTELGLTNRFQVKLKSSEDLPELETFALDNGAMIVHNSPYMPLWYSLVCLPDCTLNALELANKAYESGEFAATAVDFVGGIEVCARYNDPGYTRQWNLHNPEYGYDIEFGGVHDITTGDPSITVAVIDNSVKLGLADLKIDKSWDAMTGTSPAKNYNTDGHTHHGTSVCSVIGATPNNGRGIVGIAPDATLLGISINFHNLSLDHCADAISYAIGQGADVINCSWEVGYEHPQLTDAIDRALTEGRDGKGCVVVFASGNSQTSQARYPMTLFPDILNVGGASKDGSMYYKSNYGSTLDVVAPGSMVPVLDTLGQVVLQEGTSFAAPQVSAAAALILSENPHLSGKDVCKIIETTARKVPHAGGKVESRPHGEWNMFVGYGWLQTLSAISYGGSATIENKVIADNVEKTGWFVFMENVAVDPGGSLTLNTMNGVHIRAPFVVAQGGELRLTVK